MKRILVAFLITIVFYSCSDGTNGKYEIVDFTAPRNFAVSQTSSSVNLSWSNMHGASSYRIYRANAYTPYKEIKETSSTNYTDNDVAFGKTYFYAVSAVNSDKESNKSFASIKFNGDSNRGNIDNTIKDEKRMSSMNE